MNSFGFLILIVAFAFLWFVLVRPQKRRQTQVSQMLESLKVGDEVLTAGGIYGRIVRIVDDEIALEIADGVEVKIARRAVAGVTPEEEPVEAAEPLPEEPAAEEPEEPGAGAPTAENDG